MPSPSSPTAFPGDFLSHEEEFAATGESVYVDKSDVFALRDGKLDKNDSARTVTVHARKTVRPAKPGDVGFGRVRDLHPTMAAIEIVPLGPKGTIPVIGETLVYCRISEIQRGFLESFREVLRVGDVVRVRFCEFKRLAAYVTMKEPDLGVVIAHCSECRSEMMLRGDHAECPNCGLKEGRKIADFSWANAAEFRAPRERPPRREGGGFEGRPSREGGDRGGFGGRGGDRDSRPPRREGGDRPAFAGRR